MKRSIVKTCIIALMILLFSVCLIIFPKQSLHASVSGLHIWLEVVFPSLFPFFISAELFTRYGIAYLIGYIFEPIMRPLFNIPGIGSIALLIGMFSGYPSGAKISTQLRKEQLLSRTEAERLLAFTNNASPLFIFGVIAIGFYQNEQIGFIILIIHYLSNIFVGLCMRFYKADKKSIVEKQRFQLIDGIRKMHRFRLKNQQPIGQQLSDIIIQSVQTLCIIGGYIILFSVITTMLELLSFQYVMTTLFKPLFDLFNIPSEVVSPIITGLFEITLGTQQLAAENSLSFSAQIIGVCFLLGFNGLSVHAQVASIISSTDIRYMPYLLGRILHSGLSVMLAILLLPLFKQMNQYEGKHVIIDVSSPLFHTYNHYFYLFAGLFSIIMISIACYLLIKKTFR